MQDHLNQAEQDKSKEKQKQRMLIAWKIIYILSRYTHTKLLIVWDLDNMHILALFTNIHML